MVFVQKLLSVAAVCGVGIHGARVAKKRSSRVGVASKVIAGVPVFNYENAFKGTGSLVQQETLSVDWVLVGKKGTTDEQLASLCNLATCMKQGHPDQGGMPFFEIHGTEDDLTRVLKAADGMMEFVEPDGVVELIPELESEEASASWGLDRIGAPLKSSAGAGATVFVLDTGIRPTHVEFGGRVVPTLDMSSGSRVVCNGDMLCANDGRGHGTHCAGTVGGSTFGVAPEAVLGAIQVLSSTGSGSWSWSYEALDFLATSDIRPAVASMSLGGQGTQNAMATAVNTAVSAGVVVVVAGGNSNDDACAYSPAFVPSAITVGSTTSNDVRSSFSNYGICTDIWAPGSRIISAVHDADEGSTTKSGTSMACPHVSGAAALILGQNPTKTSAEVLSMLLDGAVTNAIDDLKDGDVNKLLYVGAGGPPPTPVPPTPAPTPASSCKSVSDDASGPDRDGDCRCSWSTECYAGGVRGKCIFSMSSGSGRTSSRFFLPGCTNCECK